MKFAFFATIVTLVAVASAATTCGDITVSMYSDSKCKKAVKKDKKAVVKKTDMSKVKNMDKCVQSADKRWSKIHCDTISVMHSVYTDKLCKKEDKTRSTFLKWGVC